MAVELGELTTIPFRVRFITKCALEQFPSNNSLLDEMDSLSECHSHFNTNHFTSINPYHHYPSTSQRINKLRILSISQIQPLLILQLLIPRPRPHSRLLRILPLTPKPDEQNNAKTQAIADQNRNNPRNVSRSILGSENLRSNDIAHAVGNEVHSCNSSFLRIARHVTADQTQQTNERSRAGLREVVSRESAAVV